MEEMPDRDRSRHRCCVLLPKRLRRFEPAPLGLLLLTFRDQGREISRFAERIADLIDIQEEDLLAVFDHSVPGEAGAEPSRGPADVGVVAAVEPVVVLLRQRTGRACRHEHLLEPCEVGGSARERPSRVRLYFVRSAAKPGVSDTRILARRPEALRDGADEERRNVCPCDRNAVIAGRAGIAVHAEEFLYRTSAGS